MPHVAEQKIKLLILYDLLCRYTDENHALNTDEIIALLAEKNIKVVRKVIVEDIALLNEYGYEVLTYKKKYHYYYVVNRHFDSAEIAFLADAVQASKLSATQKQTLTNKLMTTMGDFQATELTTAARFGTMPKRNNRYIIYTIDTLKQAIANNKKVSFKYYTLDYKKNKVYRKGGAGAIRAATEFENSNRYKTMFTGSAAYPFLAKNMGWEYNASKITIPYFMAAGTGKSDDAGVENIYEKFGGVCPLEALKDIYGAMSNDVFKVRARIKGAEHEDMLTLTDGYMTAWMCWQLQGDTEAGGIFFGENAEILNNTNW